MLIRRAEVFERGNVDVRVACGKIAEIARSLAPATGERVVDAAGGALLPGLHDHHVHLFALAAAAESIACGPPETRHATAFADALRTAPAPRTGGWLRGVGYHESVAGRLDRLALDARRADAPLRVQHRSGSAWFLNSPGVDRLGLDDGFDAPGVERDADGRATGRLFRLDTWLRSQIGEGERPGLGDVGTQLARFGVTGVTDATPANGPADLAAFVDAVETGALPQRVRVMGGPALRESGHARVYRGARKVRLAEDDLPRLEDLASTIEAARADGRATAIHCVTRAELVLAAAAFAAAGAEPGDRIEHAAIAPPDIVALLATLPLTVVTQPHFLAERGDDYLRDVAAADRAWLYRCRGLVESGIALAGGTDAPFGSPDPWRAMSSAVDRRSADGVVMGRDECLSPEAAFGLFATPLEAPGGAPRRITPGVDADLCLLDRPWAEARRELSSDAVIGVWSRGDPIWQA